VSEGDLKQVCSFGELKW